MSEVIENEGVDFGENKVNEDISKELGEKTLFAALYGCRLEYEDDSGSEDEDDWDQNII